MPVSNLLSIGLQIGLRARRPQPKQLRAAWLVRHQDRLLLLLVFVVMPVGEIKTATIILQFDRETGIFQYEPSWHPSQRLHARTLGPAAQVLFVALMLVREVSPLLEASPFPTVMRGSENSWEWMVDVREATACLIRARDPTSGRDLHVPRAIAPDDYLTIDKVVAPRMQRALHITATVAFSHYDAETLRQQIAAMAV